MNESNGTDPGCGLRFKEGYDRLELVPIKFVNGKIYRVPCCPFSPDPDRPEEAELIEALDNLDAITRVDEVDFSQAKLRYASVELIHKALSMVYKDVPESVPAQRIDFRLLYNRLLGMDAEQLKNVAGLGANS